jgi:hypothetical protein
MGEGGSTSRARGRAVERGPDRLQDPGAAVPGRAVQDMGIEGWDGVTLTCGPGGLLYRVAVKFNSNSNFNRSNFDRSKKAFLSSKNLK